MGFNIQIRKVHWKDRDYIGERNVDHFKSHFENDKGFKPFDGYEEVDFDDAGIIYNDDFTYRLFSDFNRIVESELQKEFSGFKVNREEERWTFAGDDEELERFAKLAPFFTYHGDSSGWTWTCDEVQRIKDFLEPKGLWSKIGKEALNIFETVINNDAVVTLN